MAREQGSQFELVRPDFNRLRYERCRRWLNNDAAASPAPEMATATYTKNGMRPVATGYVTAGSVFVSAGSNTQAPAAPAPTRNGGSSSDLRADTPQRTPTTTVPNNPGGPAASEAYPMNAPSSNALHATTGAGKERLARVPPEDGVATRTW